MRRLSTLALSLTVAATGVALVSPTAEAASRRHSETVADAAHDVMSLDESTMDDGPTTFTAEPDHRAGDVLSTTAVHAPRTVRMGLREDALLPGGPTTGQDWSVYGFEVHTSKRRAFVVLVEPSNAAGTRARTHLENSSTGSRLRCAGLSTRITAGSVRVVVPRRCIGRPAWVRAGAGTVMFTGDRGYLDDARVTGLGQDALMSFPRQGARLYR